MRKLDSCGLHLGLSSALKTFFFPFCMSFFFLFCCVMCVSGILKLISGTQKREREGGGRGHDRDGAVAADNRSGRVNDRALPDPSHHRDSVCAGRGRGLLAAPSVALRNQLQHLADGDGFTWETRTQVNTGQYQLIQKSIHALIRVDFRPTKNLITLAVN